MSKFSPLADIGATLRRWPALLKRLRFEDNMQDQVRITDLSDADVLAYNDEENRFNNVPLGSNITTITSSSLQSTTTNSTPGTLITGTEFKITNRRDEFPMFSLEFSTSNDTNQDVTVVDMHVDGGSSPIFSFSHGRSPFTGTDGISMTGHFLKPHLVGQGTRTYELRFRTSGIVTGKH